LGGLVKIIPPGFYALISKFLTTACILSTMLGIGSVEAAPQGFIEGHLKIVFSRPVEPDEMPSPEVAPESYAEYPLVILSREEKKEIARLTADANGNYRAALPPGDYILDVQKRPANRIQANPQPFTIAPNQTVHVDMTVLVGFYKGQA
jgi:hypothetical protein